MGGFFTVSQPLSMMFKDLDMISIDETCLIGSGITPFAAGTFLFLFCFRSIVCRLTLTMADQVGLLITIHGEWCTSFQDLLGLIALTTIYFLFPETSQPGERGIDKMKATNGANSSRSFIFINPLRSLWLLRSPLMLLTVRFNAITYTKK